LERLLLLQCRISRARLEIPPEEARIIPKYPGYIGTIARGLQMTAPAKITIQPDPELARRIEVERARLAVETGLPTVSTNGAICAVLRRALVAPEAEKPSA
jgi:hypothetical protein